MDIEMKASENTRELVTWDFKLTADGHGIATVSGKQEDKQKAIIASFLQKGTIPQLQDTGNRHAELLLDQVSPAEYQQDMIDNIKKLADTISYSPVFVAKGGKLMIEIMGN